MAGDTDEHGSEADRTPSAGAAVLRLAILMLLIVAAFRQDLRSVVRQAWFFSDWGHVLALPVIVVLYLRCRWKDLRAAPVHGSGWGVGLLLVGVLIWFAPQVMSQFGFAKLIGVLACILGALLTTTGWTVLRICAPLLIIAALCMPLSERSMDRFSIDVQRASLNAAIASLNVMTPMTFTNKGLTIAYEDEASGRNGSVGLAEQRFGMRLIHASLVVGLLTVFSRRRPGWQIALLALLSVPIVGVANILRIDAWALIAIYGEIEHHSGVARNLSMGIMLVLVYLCFALSGRLLAIFERTGTDNETAGDPPP